MQIAGCALLVSAGSFVMFPASFIYFGVLHGMAVMLLIARCTAGWGRWLSLAGLVAVALPWAAQQLLTGGWADAAPWFNGRALNWLGLVSRKPFTEDYARVAVARCALVGLAAGQWAVQARKGLAAVAATRRAHAAGNAGAVEPELLHGPPAGDDWPADGCGVGDGADLNAVNY